MALLLQVETFSLKKNKKDFYVFEKIMHLLVLLSIFL